MSEADVTPTNWENVFADFVRQIRELRNRIEALEGRISSLAIEKANPAIPSSIFANAPSAAVGQLHWFTDRTFPGAPNAGVLGVWSGTLWLASGQDVSAM